jgi:hypothetical protein
MDLSARCIYFCFGGLPSTVVYIWTQLMDTIHNPENGAAVINLIIFVSDVFAKPEVSTFVHV